MLKDTPPARSIAFCCSPWLCRPSFGCSVYVASGMIELNRIEYECECETVLMMATKAIYLITEVGLLFFYLNKKEEKSAFIQWKTMWQRLLYWFSTFECLTVATTTTTHTAKKGDSHCMLYTLVYVTTAFAHSIIRDILHINRFSAQSVQTYCNKNDNTDTLTLARQVIPSIKYIVFKKSTSVWDDKSHIIYKYIRFRLVWFL